MINASEIVIKIIKQASAGKNIFTQHLHVEGYNDKVLFKNSQLFKKQFKTIFSLNVIAIWLHEDKIVVNTKEGNEFSPYKIFFLKDTASYFQNVNVVWDLNLFNLHKIGYDKYYLTFKNIGEDYLKGL